MSQDALRAIRRRTVAKLLPAHRTAWKDKLGKGIWRGGRGSGVGVGVEARWGNGAWAGVKRAAGGEKKKLERLS